MSAPAKTYTYSWTCKTCAQQNSFERTKYQAAFEHRPKIPPCDQCGGTKYSAASASMPDIDLELLEIWAADDQLYFLDQDEDLILAEVPLEVLRAFLENAPENKMRVGLLIWMSVLKLYGGRFQRPEDRVWCIQYLRQHQDQWGSADNGYIWKRVLPILNGDTH